MAGYLKGRQPKKSSTYSKGYDNHKHDFKKDGTCTKCDRTVNYHSIGHNTPLDEQEDRIRTLRKLT